MKRNVALVAGAVAGALAATIFRRRLADPRVEAGIDPRAEELRRKLAEARQTSADEDDFQVAGMGAETVVVEERRMTREERPPSDEFEAMRRRVHAEGRAAAEQMKRRSEEGEAGQTG